MFQIVNKAERRRYSNSDDSSFSQDEVIKEDLRGSLGIKPQSIISSIRGSVKQEESKLEMSDFRASEDQLWTVQKQKKTGAIVVHNEGSESVKSAKSFEEVLQESPQFKKEGKASKITKTPSLFVQQPVLIEEEEKSDMSPIAAGATMQSRG